MLEEGASQLVERPHIVAPQAQSRKAATVRWLFVRRPAEKIFVKCLGLLGVCRGEIKPAELSDVCFVQVDHDLSLAGVFRPRDWDAAGRAGRRRLFQEFAVSGSMTVRTSAPWSLESH